jgi:phospholipid transport system substrate-binding protein
VRAMLRRRDAMTLIGTTVLLVTPPGAIWYALAQSGVQAITFVKSTTDQLVGIVNSADPSQQKRRRLREVINSSVDVDDIARFCLGRFWRIATDDQQKQYMALFPDLLVAKIASHLGEYQGVRVTMGLARTSEDTEIVITTVERPNNPASRVDWVVSTTTGATKIIDLLAEGTSLRLTQSADLTAYLSRHQYNIHELIEGMRQPIARSQ